VAASNPPPITFEGRESRLEIRGNPQPQFARKSTQEPQFPANPIAGIPAISIARQSLRDISRTTHYLEEGVTILEMARNAQRLFDSEEPMQKRRLLNFVVSNSTWANGELNANLREPFGFIAEMAVRHECVKGGSICNRLSSQ